MISQASLAPKVLQVPQETKALEDELENVVSQVMTVPKDSPVLTD